MNKKIVRISTLLMMIIMSLVILRVQPALAESRTITLQVENMTCGVCTHTVKKSLKKVPGVTDAKVTLEPPEAIVTFDDTKTTVEDLTQATGQAGYPSKPINKTK